MHQPLLVIPQGVVQTLRDNLLAGQQSGWRWPSPGRSRRSDAFVLDGPLITLDRSFENQAYRAPGLNLLVAAIILWNTRCLQATFDALRARGQAVRPDLVATSLGHEEVCGVHAAAD